MVSFTDAGLGDSMFIFLTNLDPYKDGVAYVGSDADKAWAAAKTACHPWVQVWKDEKSLGFFDNTDRYTMEFKKNDICLEEDAEYLKEIAINFSNKLRKSFQ